MEFIIKTNGVQPDLGAINDALVMIDPMALADTDTGGSNLLVSAQLGSADLLALLAQAGYPVDWRRLEQVPSVCCGACGG
jgi:hypothetical protein